MNCIDCKHFIEPDYGTSDPYRCAALRGQRHPVFGTTVGDIEAGFMRATLCGWTDPKLFEPVVRADD